MTSAEKHSVYFQHENHSDTAEDCLAASSEMGEMTTTLQSCLSAILTDTGLKMQLICTLPGAGGRWINLNLVLPKEIPIDDLRRIPVKTDSIPTNGVIPALTNILLLKMFLKKVEIQSTDESVDHLLTEVDRIGTQIIAMRAISEKDFIGLYEDLVKSVTQLTEALILKKWTTKFQYHGIRISEEELFCEVIGFTSELAKGLERLDEYCRQHQPIDYHIEKFMEIELVNSRTGGRVDDSNLEILLAVVGVSTGTVGIIRDMIATDKTQLAMYWVLKYMRQMISSHILLNADVCVGYHPHLHDAWFGVTVDRLTSRQSKEIDMRNVSEHAQFAEHDIIEHCAPKTKLWYHGTNGFDAAHSILKEGIKRKGAATQDFSNHSGFYLTDSFATAKNYAKKGGTKRHAILVFEDNIDPARWGVLDLEGRDETWEQVVRYYRTHEWRKTLIVTIPNREEVTQKPVDELDCIKGSICSDIKKFMDGAIDGRKVQQMCVKGKLAKHFGSLDNIRAVLWYSG